MKKLLLLVFFSLGAPVLFAQQAVTDAKVLKAADSLLTSQSDPDGWKSLQEVIRSETYSADIRSRVMYVFAVTHLLHMNTNLFASAMQALEKGYPNESLSLVGRLTSSDWLVPCPECGGTGVNKAVSPAGQSGPVRCLTCVGIGKVFQLSPRVKEQVGAVLAEIKAIAAENIQFAEAAGKALAERLPQRRVTALRELVAKYAHRKDLAEAKELLARTEAELAEADALARQKEAQHALRDQEDKDYQAICSNLESLPDSGIAVMTREIDRFIETFPQSSRRIELEIQKTRLLQRKKTRAAIWVGFYVCTGLAAFSVLLSLVKELFARKRKTTGLLVVPGLSEKCEEADPLAGTFADDDSAIDAPHNMRE